MTVFEEEPLFHRAAEAAGAAETAETAGAAETAEAANVADTANAAEELMLSLDEGDLHVCLDGPRKAPALLLVHGSASSVRSWDRLVPLLSTAHRVIRIDLPGHGRSAEPAGRRYGIPAQAHAVGTALDRLGIAHAVAVGHSSGGYAVTALAGQRPELVTALALINTGPALEAFIAPDSAPPDPAEWPPSDEEIRRFSGSGFRAGYEIPQEFVDELRGMNLHAISAAMQGSLAHLKEQPLPERLAALGKPLQVIFGDQDRRWRPSSAADYRLVPGAQITMLPGAGHTPILEDPPRTAALLLAFTSESPAARW
jgi:pimeloyl-ACP methyl ester carboxylesterase